MSCGCEEPTEWSFRERKQLTEASRGGGRGSAITACDERPGGADVIRRDLNQLLFQPRPSSWRDTGVSKSALWSSEETLNSPLGLGARGEFSLPGARWLRALTRHAASKRGSPPFPQTAVAREPRRSSYLDAGLRSERSGAHLHAAPRSDAPPDAERRVFTHESPDTLSASMFRLYESYSKEPQSRKGGNTVRSFRAVPRVLNGKDVFQFNLSSIPDSEVSPPRLFAFSPQASSSPPEAVAFPTASPLLCRSRSRKTPLLRILPELGVGEHDPGVFHQRLVADGGRHGGGETRSGCQGGR
ncbi:Growth/differentiation factor 10 [Oryzias melastigma]|uniref:Growth/differentiation factor 10 n=1 Tax=Oryzias melastigma TaxID=30732 RepID=A0A834F687_ORYME|nr:Growth/differentiation factor 10 [Oryzias melastigma]